MAEEIKRATKTLKLNENDEKEKVILDYLKHKSFSALVKDYLYGLATGEAEESRQTSNTSNSSDDVNRKLDIVLSEIAEIKQALRTGSVTINETLADVETGSVVVDTGANVVEAAEPMENKLEDETIINSNAHDPVEEKKEDIEEYDSSFLDDLDSMLK